MRDRGRRQTSARRCPHPASISTSKQNGRQMPEFGFRLSGQYRYVFWTPSRLFSTTQLECVRIMAPALVTKGTTR